MLVDINNLEISESMEHLKELKKSEDYFES